MSAESEYLILGGIMSDNQALHRIDLTPEEFSLPDCAEIYRAAIDLDAANEPYDFMVLNEFLGKRTNRVWTALLAQIGKNSLGSRNIEQYAKSVRQDHLQTKARAVANQLMSEINHKGQDAIDQAVQDLMEINLTRQQTIFSMKECCSAAMDTYEEAERSEGVIGITTGLNELDEITTGFRNTDLYVIGARPAMGKTALMLNFASAPRVPIGVISAEQAQEQVGSRMLSINGRIDSHNFRRGKLEPEEWSKLTATIGNLRDRQIWVCTTDSPTILELRREARFLKFRYNIQALYVDYIQRIQATNTKVNKSEQVEEVVKGLKSLAKELNIPVIALAQVKREVDTRNNKRPNMSDISDSSAVEKEADCVMTLYRDEVYNADTELKGIAEIIICKSRHGQVGCVSARWSGKFLTFDNLKESNGDEY